MQRSNARVFHRPTNQFTVNWINNIIYDYGNCAAFVSKDENVNSHLIMINNTYIAGSTTNNITSTDDSVYYDNIVKESDNKPVKYTCLFRPINNNIKFFLKDNHFLETNTQLPVEVEQYKDWNFIAFEKDEPHRGLKFLIHLNDTERNSKIELFQLEEPISIKQLSIKNMDEVINEAGVPQSNIDKIFKKILIERKSKLISNENEITTF